MYGQFRALSTNFASLVRADLVGGECANDRIVVRAEAARFTGVIW